MANWLERAKSEIQKSADQSTDNTDERNLTAVTTVPNLGKSEIKTTPSFSQFPVTEDQTAKAPAEPQTDEVDQILAVWRDLGIKDLDAQRAKEGLKPVKEHLADLRAHEAQWGVEDAKTKKGES